MNETLTTFETAKLANEKGFNLIVRSMYHYNGSNCVQMTTKNSENLGVSAPTQALLQKWLRDVHNIHIELYYHWGVPKKYGNNKNYILLAIWRYSDIGLSQHIEINAKGNYSKYGSYEEVLEIGLQEALKLIP